MSSSTRTGWSVVLVGVTVGVAASAVDILRLDDGGTLRLTVQDTGAMAVSAADSTRPGLEVTQSGPGKVLTLFDGPGEVFTVADGGRVGVNQANPLAALDVGGDIRVSGLVDGVDVSAHTANAAAHHTPPTSLPPSGAAGGDLSGTYPSPQVNNDSHTHADGTVADWHGVNNGRLFAPAGSGYVGIGTTAPAARLHIGNGSGPAGIAIDDNATAGVSPTITQSAAASVFGGAASNADAWHTHASAGGGGAYEYSMAQGTATAGAATWTSLVSVTGPGVLYSVTSSNNNGAGGRVWLRIDGVSLIRDITTTSPTGVNTGGATVQFKNNMSIEHMAFGGTTTTIVFYGK